LSMFGPCRITRSLSLTHPAPSREHGYQRKGIW
jgi:hypothetical protein